MSGPGPNRWGKAFLAAVVGAPLLLIAGCGVVLALGRDGDGRARAEALVACHSGVEARLRAPATADFGGERIEQVGGGWRIAGHVDAENGLGGTVRSQFVCTGIAGAMRVEVLG